MSSPVSTRDYKLPHYSQLLRETAFELWFTVTDQNCVEVHRILSEDEPWRVAAGLVPGQPAPDLQTITRWKRQEYWPVKLRDRLIAVAPNASAAAAYRLIAAQANAADVMEEILDSGTMRDKVRFEAAKFILEPVMSNLVEFSKPKTIETIDRTKITTMKEAIEAENKQRELMAKNDQ